jgi:hypothetical protein
MKSKSIFLALLLLPPTGSCSHSEEETDPPETQENVVYDYLAATDALGRRLPSHEEAGDVRENKYVGLFYWTWHTQLSAFGAQKSYNVSEILKEHPDAIHDFYHPAWPANAISAHGVYYYWGEPLYGYYLDTDRWVLRRHAELLALAGVDVIIFDCTNGNFTWKESYMELCSVFAEARNDGVRTPQIAFLLAFGATQGSKEAIEEIYRDLYKPGVYKDLFFMWKGKPLIMAYPDNLSDELKNYFTFRPGQPVYNTGPMRDDHWGWLEIYPQNGYARRYTGGYEQATVGVAQNWSAERGLTAMNAPNVFGRSYTAKSGRHNEPDAVNYGYNFQEQWDRALEIDPQFIFITGWNEWIAGRYETWQQQYNAFPDQFSREGSRDIEPMKGGHGDNYYYQMAANIRRFKGVGRPEPASAPATIAVDGRFDDWKDVTPLYETPAGNTLERNSPGWAGLYYEDKTGRNDFVRAKVARDDNYLYFYIETAGNITPAGDPGWMRLFIDSDRSRSTGWEGYDYVVNRLSPADQKATVERNTGAWNWESCAEAEYYVSGKQMELRIPRRAVAPDRTLNFEFKWSDNMQQESDVMDFYLHGDVAPAGRYNFIYREK